MINFNNLLHRWEVWVFFGHRLINQSQWKFFFWAVTCSLPLKAPQADRKFTATTVVSNKKTKSGDSSSCHGWPNKEALRSSALFIREKGFTELNNCVWGIQCQNTTKITHFPMMLPTSKHRDPAIVFIKISSYWELMGVQTIVFSQEHICKRNIQLKKHEL